MTLAHLPLATVQLDRGIYDDRRKLNRDYLRSLRPINLLQNHYIQAGIGSQLWHMQPSQDSPTARGLDRHWGWETPGALLRGHFTGHWLSAAAREVAVTDDPVLRSAIDEVLDGLARCQDESDGEWMWAIPPSFLTRLERDQEVWAPQYDMHKTLMGLVDVHRELGDERALTIADRGARALLRWVRGIDEETFQRILDVETGGMLEVWADLLEFTGDAVYRELLGRYRHDSLFDPLRDGQDVLTNMHANTTIPEILGAARAYEVTGDDTWRQLVESYWEWAVTRRGTFCTGGQTSGEIWTPPFSFAARRGDKTQEHCAVYNMIRLADVLLRWTGELGYADYIERNLLNGILAQQNPQTGMVAYFLPLNGGATKAWGSPTEDFWCCHGTLVQAHTRHAQHVFYTDDEDTLTIAQFIAAHAEVPTGGGTARVSVELPGNADEVGPDSNAGEAGDLHRPHALRVRVVVDSPDALRMRVRIPEWTAGAPLVSGDIAWEVIDGALLLTHTGGTASVDIALPWEVRVEPIPDEPGTVAFLEGPVVLAGLVDRETALRGPVDAAADLITADDERHWSQWRSRYRTVGQQTGIRFVPLHEVVDEPYAVYFPVH